MSQGITTPSDNDASKKPTLSNDKLMDITGNKFDQADNAAHPITASIRHSTAIDLGLARQTAYRFLYSLAHFSY